VSLPAERARAVKAARDFLFELLDPRKAPNVQGTIRFRASCILKHYPSHEEIEEAFLTPAQDTATIQPAGNPPEGEPTCPR
jgi:hypothetical protein